MSRVLKLTFLTEAGGKVSYSIDNIKSGTIDKEDIEAVMDTMISKNIFYTSTGNLEKSYKATITETDVTEYEM